MQAGIGGARGRLLALIQRKYGAVSPEALRTLASDARVHYTSLARYLLYPKARATRSLRLQTLSSVAVVLDANPDWIRDGVGAKQLGLWPILVKRDAEAEVDLKPLDQMRSVIDQVAVLPERVQIRALRGAVAAMLEIVVGEGFALNDEAYRCLMRLDALGRSFRRAG